MDRYSADIEGDVVRSPNGDAARAVARSRGCGACGYSTPPGSRFCPSCGHSLVILCPSCGAACVEETSYCGECGTNIQALLRSQEAELQEKLDEARELKEQWQLERAIARLRVLADLKDERYQRIANHAKTLIDECTVEHERWIVAGENTGKLAQEHIDQHRYAEAITAIERIPAPLRGDTLDSLLNEAMQRKEEIETLKRGIGQALRNNAVDDLSIMIDRLQTLRPGSQKVAQIAKQLRTRLMVSAKKCVAQHRHGKARELLDRIPASQRDATFEKLFLQVTELEWMQTDLQLAPLVDPALIAIAQRLAKLTPRHEETQRITQKIARLSSGKPSDPRAPYPVWSQPKRSAVGVPVNWLAASEQFQAASETQADLRQRPGRFFVAMGLALQGLGLGMLDLNLASLRETGVLGKLGLKKKRREQVAWGLDLGSASLKAVQLRQANREDKVSVAAVYEIPHQHCLTQVADEVKQRELIVASLKSLKQKAGLDKEPLCVGISGALILGRFFWIPLVPTAKLSEVIRFEAQQQIPLRLEDVNLAYHVYSQPSKEISSKDERKEPAAHTGKTQDTSGRMLVALQTVKKYHANMIGDVFDAAGLHMATLQSDCMALHNFASFEFDLQNRAEDTRSVDAFAMLDVGARGTNMVISSGESIWFRRIGVGGEVLTNRLIEALKATREQAEILKQQPTKAKSLSKVYRAIEPELSLLYAEVQRSLELHARLFPEVRIRCLYGLGGGFALHGLMRRLVTGQ